MPAPTTYFALPDDRSPKADPDLVGADDAHFAALDAALQHAVATAALRLDEVRRLPGGTGQEALDRDQEVHRLSTRLRVLRRHGVEMCLGRTTADDGETLYVGRVGVSDAEGRRLLVDWRTPAAEPFFAATHADPRGLGSRRRYRWAGGRVTDYWDEVLTPEALEAGGLALDDESAFVAGLGRSREPRMRDVLATIQADQDAVVRAPARGALVVDGGPGTGKTVVALHRAAYLLHADPHLAGGRGDVLVVGPHPAYLAYVADVLPSLGEEGVRTCTLRDLVPEGRDAVVETDDEVRRLKVGRTAPGGRRGGGEVLRGAADHRRRGGDAVGRRAHRPRDVGAGVRRPGPGSAARRGARRRMGRADPRRRRRAAGRGGRGRS